MKELQSNQTNEINGGSFLNINWANEGRTFADGASDTEHVQGETGRIMWGIGHVFG